MAVGRSENLGGRGEYVSYVVGVLQVYLKMLRMHIMIINKLDHKIIMPLCCSLTSVNMKMILDYLIIWKKLDLVKSTKSPTITLKVFSQLQNESFILKYTYQAKLHNILLKQD